MSTYEHTVILRQREDEKNIQLSPNNKTINNKKSAKEEKIPTISNKELERPRTPPIDLKYELPPLNIGHVDPELGGGIDNNTSTNNKNIKPSVLPSLPPLKPLNKQRIKNNLNKVNNSLDNELNASTSERPHQRTLLRNNHSIDHALPCIMSNKNYLELNETMNSDSRDSSNFSGYPTNRTDIEQLNTDSNVLSNSSDSTKKTTSKIIKLPNLAAENNDDEQGNQMTVSTLSNTIENKRKHRKLLLSLSATPQSNRSNVSSPEPQTNVKYLNSSNLKRQKSSQGDQSDFRMLKNYTPSSNGQDSDDDIIVGNSRNLNNSLVKNYRARNS